MSITIKQQAQKYSTCRTFSQDNISYYLDGLYSTLVELQPKYCLEIGTNYGGSARVFQDYFNEYKNDGVLITLDIKKYGDLSELKNVKQVIVYPYDDTITKWHYVTENELLSGFNNWDKALVNNIELLKKEVDFKFDFAFIDGDHFRQSLLNDINLCLEFTNHPNYMLIDDVDDNRHESTAVFEELKLDDTWKSYDFSDWTIKTGIGLIWK